MPIQHEISSFSPQTANSTECEFEENSYVEAHISVLLGAMQLSFGSSVVLLSRVKPPKDSCIAPRYLEICSLQDKFLVLTRYVVSGC